MGARLLKRWMVLPLNNIAKINERLHTVEYLIKEVDFRNKLSQAIKQAGDVERLVSKVPLKKVNPREVLQIAKGLQQTELIKKICETSTNEYLKRLGDSLNPCKYILDKILKELMENPPVAASKGSVIAGGINKELDDLRKIASGGKDFLVEIQQREALATGISSLKISFNNVFGYYLEVTHAHKSKVPDTWIRKQTLVNAERYITPELKEYEEKIIGAEDKMLAIEMQLFEELLNELQDYISPMQVNGHVMAVIDCLCCFANNALQFKYKKPTLQDDFILDIKDSRHPVIEQNLPVGETYIANDIYLDPSTQQIIIGTPDHWHCIQMVEACQAGKDVYVEKPVGNSIEECRIMVAAQKKYGRVVQAGQWQRSQQHFKDAVDFIATGQLGNIRTVKVWSYVGWKQPISFIADSPVPAGVDYERWLGPASKRPFNANRFHFSFRWFWDYAGGLMTDWGVHLLDYALLGMKADVPKTISALGGNFAAPDSPQETPDTLCALYQFEKFNLVWDHAIGIDNGLFKKDHGIAFTGSNGTLELDRGGWEVIEEGRSAAKVAVERKPSVDNGLDKHMENFVQVIRNRKMAELNCPIDAAAHVAIVSQMGNIAFRSGEKLDWNKAAGKFTNESVNRKYMAAPYHNGYNLPKV